MADACDHAERTAKPEIGVRIFELTQVDATTRAVDGGDDRGR